MTADLKPCPWCGKAEHISITEMCGEYWVVCKSGGIEGHAVFSPSRRTEAAAIKAWNERRPR